MNKKLSDWASIAEIFSGVAVVITLVVLVVSIRESTDITRAAVYESHINSLMQWRSELAHDRDVTRLWQSIFNGEHENLDETDFERMMQIVANNLNIYEKAYFAREYGVMGQSEWSRFEAPCRQYEAALLAGLTDILNRIMTPDFIEYLDGRCETSQISRPPGRLLDSVGNRDVR